MFGTYRYSSISRNCWETEYREQNSVATAYAAAECAGQPEKSADPMPMHNAWKVERAGHSRGIDAAKAGKNRRNCKQKRLYIY